LLHHYVWVSTLKTNRYNVIYIESFTANAGTLDRKEQKLYKFSRLLVINPLLEQPNKRTDLEYIA